MKFKELLRRKETPEREKSEEEKKGLGLTAIERFEKSLLLELKREATPKAWKLFESKRKEAKRLREKFQIVDQPDEKYELFPVELLLFDLYLTERLLGREGLAASRSLRMEVQTVGSSIFLKQQPKLREPEEVFEQQGIIGEATHLTNRSRELVLGEYACEIEIDPESKEFRAWVLPFERLAQNFTVSYFDGDKSRIQGLVNFKKVDIVNRRRAMLQQANLQIDFLKISC